MPLSWEEWVSSLTRHWKECKERVPDAVEWGVQWLRERGVVSDLRVSWMLAAGVGMALLAPPILRGLIRYQTVEDITRTKIHRGLSLVGRVVHVGDGDGLRVFHTPWLRFGRTPPKGVTLSASTLSIRLAGIDAPECAHFGGRGQPYGPEAKAFLTKLTLGRKVTVDLLARDQYMRGVAMVWIHRSCPLLPRINVSMEMLRAGLATVYSGMGAEYGGLRRAMERTERLAKRGRRGIWSQRGRWQTPGEYKRAKQNGGGGGGGGDVSSKKERRAL